MSLLVVDELPVDAAPAPRSWGRPARPRWQGAHAAPGRFSRRRGPRPAKVVIPSPRVAEPPAAVDADDSASATEAPRAKRTAGSRIADLALTLAAVLGLVILGITIAAHTTGMRPLVVKSGSMEPTIPTGGMVLVRTIPAAQIEVGDVVAVDRPDNTRVTHRVLKVVHKGATAELTLKGDANEDPDPIPVTVTEAGELVLSAPSIGRVSAFLASAKGGFVLGCLFTLLALPVLRRRDAGS